MQSNLKTKTLLIGGAGFIGQHLWKRLVDSGREVTVLGRRSPEALEGLDFVEYVQGDYSDLNLLKRLLDNCHEVIQLAYATVPNTSFDDPLADLNQNLPSMVNLFIEASKRDIKLLIISSGGTVYGQVDQLPIVEGNELKPISPYGVTKRVIESYAYLFSQTHGLKYICVRPSNPYGEGQVPYIGQGFISTALASLIEGRAIKLFGKGETVRDYIYMDDLASGIVAALSRGDLFETYNIGTGVGHSNLEVIKMMGMLLPDSPMLIDYLPERPFDVKLNVLDSTKLSSHTGWKPQVNFDVGLFSTLNWLTQFLVKGGFFK